MFEILSFSSSAARMERAMAVPSEGRRMSGIFKDKDREATLRCAIYQQKYAEAGCGRDSKGDLWM